MPDPAAAIAAGARPGPAVLASSALWPLRRKARRRGSAGITTDPARPSARSAAQWLLPAFGLRLASSTAGMRPIIVGWNQDPHAPWDAPRRMDGAPNRQRNTGSTRLGPAIGRHRATA